MFSPSRLLLVPTVLVFSLTAIAQDDFKEEINQAINRGVKKIKKEQQGDGSWPSHGLDPKKVGMTALCAWALLEAGVAKDDPAIAKAVKFLRENCLDVEHTYSLSTAVFFFDRHGVVGDVPYLEALGAQVLAGQGPVESGWGYNCPPLEKAEKEQIEKLTKIQSSKPKPGNDDAKTTKTKKKVHPEILDILGNLHERGAGEAPDNSNTQFAMMALWVARRHGLPVDKALRKVDARFRKFQTDKGWSYQETDPPDPTKATPAMTCAGLLAFALGNAVKPDKNKNLMEDPGVKKGMKAVEEYMDKFSEKKDTFFEDNGKNYYFLWSLERMAVIYDLKKIGKHDWYQWGAELLVKHHTQPGNWEGEHGIADTCFAILFLKRVNLAEDLTQELRLFSPIKKEK